jgi:methylmalonyl-CoA mutase cobalamin-binding domain/chain
LPTTRRGAPPSFSARSATRSRTSRSTSGERVSVVTPVGARYSPKTRRRVSPHSPVVTPADIVARARAVDAHVIGLSILSGSHVPLVRDVMARLRAEGLGHIPVVVGGIIPPEDELVLKNIGVAAVYTPKDYALDEVMAGIVRVVERARARLDA